MDLSFITLLLQPSIDFLVIFGIAGLESDFLLISDHLLLKANCPAARKENERKIAAGKINAINKENSINFQIHGQ